MPNPVMMLDVDGSVSDAQEFTFPALGSAITISRLAPSCQQAPVTLAATYRVQDETGASPGNYIEASVDAAAYLGTAGTGTVPIAADGTIYLRVVTASGAGFLRCQIEYVAAQGTVGELCTVAQVKAYMRITGTTHDAVFTALVEGASAKMEGYMRRHIVSDTYDEYHNGSGYAQTVVLREAPVIGTPTVTVGGSAYTGFELDDEAGILWYGAGDAIFAPGCWPGGIRNVRVQYTAGYASVPVDLREACIRQVAYEAKLSAVRGDFLGVPSETDPTGIAKTVDQLTWAPGVVAAMDRYKRIT